MPGPFAPTQECCSPDCTTPQSIQVPGPAGSDGTPGVDGEDGLSPVTTTTAQFLMPAEGANVTVGVLNSEGLVPNQPVFVQTAGHMLVISKPNNSSVVLQNLENTASALYPNNAAPTTPIPSGSLISPSGFQGNSGALSGAAGGQLKGTYPNPKIGIANTKGKMIVGNGTDADELAVGTDGQVSHARSAQALGQQWAGIDLTGALTSLLNTLPPSKGGTGQVTLQAAINALLAATARGDVFVRNSAGNVVPLPIGASFMVLQTGIGLDPSYSKILYAHIDSSFPVGLRRTTLVGGQTINLNGAAGSDTLLTFVIPTPTRYIVREVVLESASVNLGASAARIGLYTNTAKGGTPIVVDPNSELTANTSANIWEALTLAAVPVNTVMTSSTIYLHLSAAHGTAATVKLWIFIDDIS